MRRLKVNLKGTASLFSSEAGLH